MKNYDTLSHATNGLRTRGYTEDLNLVAQCVECPSHNLRLYPEDFIIDEFYRFEGMSNPSDSSIVYAISSKAGIKGVLVDAYGVYAESLNDAMIKKLNIKR
ncbi:MAG TPA: phosphoribosylpyrophosphate synthetase [Chryseolinea sp.]|nr:phosphoribosylpyrophosphate synthetase [Chryseolinea sp.]